MSFTFNPTAIEKEYQLIKTDERWPSSDDAEKTMIKVRIANTGDVASRDDMFSTLKREISSEQPDVVTLVSVVSTAKLRMLEARLTLSSCNILDEDGKPYFEFTNEGRIKNDSAFNKAWNKLPALVTDEISQYVRETNEQWKAQGE